MACLRKKNYQKAAIDTDSGPVVRDPQNLCRTTKRPRAQNCNNNMLTNLNNRCHWLFPFSWDKTHVHDHEWHAFLRLRAIIIHVVVLQN